MLSSIHPFGERTRNASWGRTVTSYLLGSIVGGTALGALAVILGAALRAGLNERALVSALAAAALCAAVIEWRARGAALPSWHRQVNEDWLATYRDWIYGFGFGVQLGFGIATYVTTAALYVSLLFAALLGGTKGIAIGTTFGLVRGGQILWAARVRTPDDLRTFHRRLASVAAPIRTSTAAALALAGVVVTVNLVSL